MSIRLNNPRQALCCLARAASGPGHHDNQWDQARLSVDIGEPKGAQHQNRATHPGQPRGRRGAAKILPGQPRPRGEHLDELMTAHRTRGRRW